MLDCYFQFNGLFWKFCGNAFIIIIIILKSIQILIWMLITMGTAIDPSFRVSLTTQGYTTLVKLKC